MSRLVVVAKVQKSAHAKQGVGVKTDTLFCVKRGVKRLYTKSSSVKLYDNPESGITVLQTDCAK